MKKLLFFWKELLATFWFLPVLIICFAVILSVGMVSLDSVVTISQEGWLRYFIVNNPSAARTILSTISGAMIGVAGTVFSVTLVALTLASSQFGPRLVKNFMYVRLNQIVLGSYISTYLYCLLVLNSIKDSTEFIFVPSLSILVAILAAIANIILLIVFIHRIATSMQADNVVSDISGFISKQVETLLPEKMSDDKDHDSSYSPSASISAYQNCIPVKIPRSGYLQYLSYDALVNITTKHDALIELYHRPGSYLIKGMELGKLYSNTDLEEDVSNSVINQLVIGRSKTSQQDLEYSIHQMVEIAARALSPGINDPYTAIACIDNLTSTMSYLAQAKFPLKYRFDDKGDLRVVADVIDFEGVMDAAFNQIRQFSAGITAVIIRLLEAMITIYHFTDNEDRRKAVVKHAHMILSVGRQTIKEQNDIDDLNERAKSILDN